MENWIGPGPSFEAVSLLMRSDPLATSVGAQATRDPGWHEGGGEGTPRRAVLTPTNTGRFVPVCTPLHCTN
jgi:hypothetical protein